MALKRFHQMHWFTAHYAALLSVTPRHGRAFFAHCEIPGCHEYEGMEVEDDEGILAAVVAVVILLKTTATNNAIALFLIMLKLNNLI